MTIDGTSGSTFPDGSLQATSTGYINLGTITFSGTNQQFSLTGLTLTSYKQLYIVMNGINQGVTGGTKLSISGLTGDQTATYISITMGAAGTQYWIYGSFFVDLVTGITNGQANYIQSTTSATMPASTGSTQNAKEAITGIGNASTAIYVYFTSATGTRSGTLTVYGVR